MKASSVLAIVLLSLLVVPSSFMPAARASASVVATIPVGTPFALAYDSAKGEIFVANNAESTVNVISDASNTVVAPIPVGVHPAAVAYDSAKGGSPGWIRPQTVP